MEEQYRKEIAWWFAELGSDSEVDNYLALFPELNSRLAKFAIGILKWNITRLIDINNPDDVSDGTCLAFQAQVFLAIALVILSSP